MSEETKHPVNSDDVMKRILILSMVGVFCFAAVVFTTILPNW